MKSMPRYSAFKSIATTPVTPQAWGSTSSAGLKDTRTTFGSFKWGGGVDDFDPTTGVFTHYDHNPDDPPPGATTRSPIQSRGPSRSELERFERAGSKTGRFTRFATTLSEHSTLINDSVTILPEGENECSSLPWMASGVCSIRRLASLPTFNIARVIEQPSGQRNGRLPRSSRHTVGRHVA